MPSDSPQPFPEQPAARGRLEWLSAVRNRPNAVLVAILGVGAGLRILMTIGMWPTYLADSDVWQYVATADADIYGDPIHPAGYPMFLRVLRPLSSSVLFPTVVQHALGLLGAWLLYDAARRAGAGRWWSLIPAGVMALSLDQVVTEHTLKTDALFAFLLVTALWALVRGHTGSRVAVWHLVAGAALGAATLVRLGAAPVLAASVVAVFVMWPGSIKDRVVRTACLALGALVLIVPYEVGLHARTDRWNPSAISGWSVYVRVAPFADCSRFEPPTGTEHLCERTDPDDRPGPDWYAWGGGPARETYGHFLAGNPELRAFARAALRAQPFDYVREVGWDVARYFLPLDARRDIGGGQPMTRIAGEGYDENVEQLASSAVDPYYSPTDLVYRPAILRFLGRLQPVFRAGTPFLLVPLLAAIAAAIWSRGDLRRWSLLAMSWAVVLVVASSLTVSYVWRYALPIMPIAAFSFAVSATALSRRVAPLLQRPEEEPLPQPDVQRRRAVHARQGAGGTG